MEIKNTPLVTVGLPVYNTEKYLAFCIQSILLQTYQNFEIIITDDGSTDKSLEIAKSFLDDRIKIYSDGTNRGISHRLNQQINLAKGKYFVRMDSDDIMFPERLEKQISYLENNSCIEVVGSSIVVVDNENKIIAFREAKKIDDYKKVFSQILFNHPTVAGKLSFFEKYKYSEEYTGVEDADLWIRSFLKNNFEVMKEPLLFYRDPYQFKLKTYKYRINQKIKLFRNNKFLANNKLLKLKLLTSHQLRIMIAVIFNFLKMDALFIARRNRKLAESERKDWEIILRKIINAK